MYKPLSGKKAIIFDFDDTLVRTREIKWAALVATAKDHYDLDITTENIEEHWGQPFKEMLCGVMGDIDSFENLQRNYAKTSESYPMLAFEDTLPTLNQLFPFFRVSILTASGRKPVIDDLLRLKFAVGSFTYIQTSEDTLFHKPDKRVFDPVLKILGQGNITKNETVYIGDSDSDELASRNAGIDFIRIDRSGIEGDGQNHINSLHKLTS
ncbi:MAG: HAD family hydrolase [Candidatus Dojkabacteria bacterium]